MIEPVSFVMIFITFGRPLTRYATTFCTRGGKYSVIVEPNVSTIVLIRGIKLDAAVPTDDINWSNASFTLESSPVPKAVKKFSQDAFAIFIEPSIVLPASLADVPAIPN